MSIAILNQVYDETRRLAVAGSVVAGGDFRLQKLIPPLELAGAKASVFARVAQAVKAVVECKEQTSAQALLELTTIVLAILHTQGETGVSGPLEPIETTDLGAPTLQASARVLKPLLEALTTTGSGRMELIKDAHERGAFRDLRLVKPALQAIDDGYAEIGDFIAEKVLPLYGKAILPELRASIDLNGRGGHPRRLQLMNALDPIGTRELVKQALDSGSKEVKIVAIRCLGAEKDDLSYLLEQARAKAQEVRQAAYRALAIIDDDAAVAALQTAMNGKDLDLASDSLSRCQNPKLVKSLIESAEAEVAALHKTKEKKAISSKINRATALVNCLSGREDDETAGFLSRVFAQRDELAKIKGDSASGSDLNTTIVRVMSYGTRALQTTLADAHVSLSPDDLAWCFRAAQRALSADKVYSLFSPYLTSKVDAKKKNRDPAWARREAIIGVLGTRDYYYYQQWKSEDASIMVDPRWLDRAVEMEHFGLVHQLIRPGHPAANAFLLKTFNNLLKTAKQFHECHAVVGCMLHVGHPDAIDCFLAVLDKFGKKADYFGYWFGRLIVDLPKSALPRLEAMIPNLNDKLADVLVMYIQQLRDKKE